MAISSQYASTKQSQESAWFLQMPKTKELEVTLSEELPQKSTLEDVFSDKCKTSKAGVNALLSEIELRQDLNFNLLNKIDDDICKQNSQLMQLENMNYPCSFEVSEAMEKKRFQLNDNILELRREKRKEYLECWKDLMLLKKDLQISLREYWNHAKKRDVLSGEFD